MAFLLFLPPACSFNYRDSLVIDEIEETVPNIRMTGVIHRTASSDRILVEMSADRSESYEKVKKIILFGVHFREYDSQGNLAAEGRADRVEYFTATKNAEIRGNIEISSRREEGGIRTGYLYWDDKSRILMGSTDELTEIYDDEGSSLSGRGFEADLKRVIISFLQAVEGDYVVSD